MPFEIIRDDITNLKTDVIVNPTNNKLQMGGGVCGAIFKKAGAEILQKECNKIGYINTTSTALTKGYNLNCKYIIHTVGPIWHGGNNNEGDLLYNTYINCLNLAKQKRCKSIAFPLISTGKLGYPKDDALNIAINAIRDFLLKNEMLIYLVVFDKNSFVINKDLFDSITQYIDDKYVESYKVLYDSRRNNEEDFFEDTLPSDNEVFFEVKKLDKPPKSKNSQKDKVQDKSILKESAKIPLQGALFNYCLEPQSLLDAISKTEETFSQSLLKLIDDSGMTDAEVYKKANIDRRLFSKIRKNKNYAPSKTTVLSLAIALELDIYKTEDLLKKAGFALSHSNKFDIIIEYFITHQIYDIYEINEALFSFDQNLLRT